MAVSEALGAVDANELGAAVDLAACHRGATRNTQGGNATVLAVRDRCENLERHVTYDVGDFGDLKGDAQVGLVRTVTAHGFGVGKARERIG